ncbi:unnamed protein product [Lactuca virosa]|uniref:Uncharacterized protein n=1 Tax=Lactuca virosa TaxID=75947 RepID=A0AAU9MEE0_9ASTR|nr:unnamed protein product [Lactuca virosa]
MELCAGDELFDRIIAKGHYSERAAAGLCRQMAQFSQMRPVAMANSMGPRMPMYPPGGPGGFWLPTTVGPWKEARWAPMSNFFLPVAAQQGQQGQRLGGTGRRGAGAGLMKANSSELEEEKKAQAERDKMLQMQVLHSSFQLLV